jgi:hypothetical protein
MLAQQIFRANSLCGESRFEEMSFADRGIDLVPNSFEVLGRSYVTPRQATVRVRSP